MTQNTHKSKHVMNNFSLSYHFGSWICFAFKKCEISAQTVSKSFQFYPLKGKKRIEKRRKGEKKEISLLMEGILYLSAIFGKSCKNQVDGPDLFHDFLEIDKTTCRLLGDSIINRVGQTISYCFFQIRSTKPLVFQVLAHLSVHRALIFFF